MTVEALTQFVDTNIFVYAHDRTASHKHEQALEIVTRLWESRNGCLSVQVMQEFYVAITQKVARPVDQLTASRLVSDLSLWQVHRPNPQDVIEAIGLHHKHRISFWDAMILQSAIQLNCREIISEDLTSGRIYSGVSVVNPFEA